MSRDVAVLDKSYIGSGAAGRNTTIIRANYGLPEAIRFYQHSLEMYQTLDQSRAGPIIYAFRDPFAFPYQTVESVLPVGE